MYLQLQLLNFAWIRLLLVVYTIYSRLYSATVAEVTGGLRSIYIPTIDMSRDMYEALVVDAGTTKDSERNNIRFANME